MAIFSKLKQFKDLRQQGKKLQSALSEESVTKHAASGQVALTMDGSVNISNLSIAPELLSPNNQEKVQNAVKDAHNDAIKKMQKIISVKMQGMEGFKMPGSQ